MDIDDAIFIIKLKSRFQNTPSLTLTKLKCFETAWIGVETRSSGKKSPVQLTAIIILNIVRYDRK